MQLPEIIGLSGQKQSGKNTLASSLEAEGYETVAFADPLREMCLALDPFVVNTDTGMHRLSKIIDSLGWDVAKERFPEVRRIMQFMGTEVVRAVKPDHWTESMRSRLSAGGRFVVADVRFPNEADLIRELGGVVIEIQRPSLIRAVDTHISEQPVPADHVLVNSGSPEDLYHAFQALSRG